MKNKKTESPRISATDPQLTELTWCLNKAENISDSFRNDETFEDLKVLDLCLLLFVFYREDTFDCATIKDDVQIATSFNIDCAMGATRAPKQTLVHTATLLTARCCERSQVSVLSI